MTILRSSAEPKGVLRTVGESSALPEQYGADFLIFTDEGMVGVQRKEIRDLIASTRTDDRIARELGQATPLLKMVLIVEGDWRWDYRDPRLPSRTCDGVLKAQVDGMLLSFQITHGWAVMHSASMVETARLVTQIASWFQKGRHNTLQTRHKAGGLWGTYTNRDFGIHWWQSIDGVGVELAGRLYDAVRVPVVWTVTEADLLAVPGVGKGRAAKILASLPSLDTVETMSA